ncbi:30S ribosomal protein S7 [Patescibacteria group bacterium]|nr:30S ribosomal protein S7 [Patescibacteria group bacterium]MBU4162472.1 30S ribosomal protein S7 [Patescibacteria group bacterium]
MSKKKYIQVKPDPIYNDMTVAKLINYIMRKGNKSIARKIVYSALSIIKEKTKQEPVQFLEKAIQNASPVLEVKSKRIGGANYQVPIEVSKERRVALAVRWIIQASKKGKGSMAEKLAKELMEAAENTGNAVKKKETVHKMAEANKAFAHFAW